MRAINNCWSTTQAGYMQNDGWALSYNFKIKFNVNLRAKKLKAKQYTLLSSDENILIFHSVLEIEFITLSELSELSGRLITN